MGVQNGGLKWGLSCDAGKNPFIKNHALAASLVSRFFRCDVEVDTAAIYLAGVKNCTESVKWSHGNLYRMAHKVIGLGAIKNLF
jgi:hypothetical protein